MKPRSSLALFTLLPCYLVPLLPCCSVAAGKLRYSFYIVRRWV